MASRKTPQTDSETLPYGKIKVVLVGQGLALAVIFRKFYAAGVTPALRTNEKIVRLVGVYIT